MKVKIKDVFNIYSGVSGLTEKTIYENPPHKVEDSVYVYSGSINESTQFPSVSKQIIPNNKIFGIYNVFIVSRNGQAGKITLPKGDFTINDHAYVFELKKQYTSIINLSYIIKQLPNLFNDCISDSDGNATFNKTLASELMLEIPAFDVQEKIANEINTISTYKKNIEIVLKQIQEVYDYKLNLTGDFYLVKEICDLETGSTIGEDLIYQNYDSKGIPVFSSKIDGPVGFVNKQFYLDSNKKGHPGDLIWATRGNAGNIKIINSEYLFTSNCGRLKINKPELVNPEFLKIILNITIKDEIIGKANLGQLTVSQLNEVGVYIPNLATQNDIVEHYKKIQLLEEEINKITI